MTTPDDVESKSLSEVLRRGLIKGADEHDKDNHMDIDEDELVNLAVEACESKIEDGEDIADVVRQIAKDNKLLHRQGEIYKRLKDD